MLKLLLLEYKTSSFIHKLHFLTFRYISQSISPFKSSSLLPSLSSSSSNLAKSILKCRSAEEMLRMLDTSKDLRRFSEVIHVLTGAQKYKLARCLIKCLSEGLTRKTKPVNVCSRLFNALGDIQSSKLDTGVFNLLIMDFLEMGLFEEALWVTRKMSSSPDLKACHAILNGLVKRRRFDSVWVDYQLMVSRGLVPDLHIYSVLFHCCYKQGLVSKKEHLLEEMASAEIKPNVYIYTILIRDLCKENKMEEVVKTLELMKEHGVVPNLYTYSAIIDGYVKNANLRQAYTLYKKILAVKLLPNVVIFGTLVVFQIPFPSEAMLISK